MSRVNTIPGPAVTFFCRPDALCVAAGLIGD